MDQRDAHFEPARVALLMDAAKKVKAYSDANPEIDYDGANQEYPQMPLPVHESGKTSG